MLVRLPFLHVPMISDEGGYAYVARFWTDSYRLYRDIPFDRPPGIFLIYRVLGSSLTAIRLGAAFWNTGTTLALFWFARETAGVRAGIAASVLFALVSTAPHLEGFTANAELFAVLPLTIAAYLTWREDWLWTGVLAGIATVIKPIGMSGVVLAVVWILYWNAGWKAVFRLCAGYAVVGGLALAHVATIDWSGFWASQMVKTGTFGEVSFLTALGQSVMHTWPAWFGLALMAAAALASDAAIVLAFGLCWLGSGLIGMALGGHWYEHYWTQIIPALVWCAAPLVTRRITEGTVISVTLAALSFGALELPLWFASPDAVSWAIYQRPAYLQEEAIAQYVKAHTQPSDTIQVGFWSTAAIYPLSDRRASVPHLFRYEYLPTRQAYADVVASIQRREPALIVWLRDLPPWDTPEHFAGIIHTSGYAAQQTFGPFTVYGR